jgi:hypothetical protein
MKEMLDQALNDCLDHLEKAISGIGYDEIEAQKSVDNFFEVSAAFKQSLNHC